ncbi:MAG: hypothetical protein PWR30_586 [Candidatus Woesearchaeota archaeon]|nr:hypothetical protein [Candidatus Woesearchaeota archaeon]
MIEKRIKANIRFFGPLKKGEKGFLIGKDFVPVADFIIKKTFHKEFFSLKKSRDEADVLIDCRTMEEIALDFLDKVIKNESIASSKIFIFCDIPFDELIDYSRIKGIKLENPKKQELPEILNSIQIQFSLISSFKNLIKSLNPPSSSHSSPS